LLAAASRTIAYAGLVQIGKEPKNEIATAIKESPFEMSDFARDEDSTSIVLVHKPTNSGATIEYGETYGMPDKFVFTWQVGDEPTTKVRGQKLQFAVERWLADIHKDLTTPDLFAEIGKPPQISSLAEEDDNRPFDAGEQAEIAKWGAELKAHAPEQYGLEGAQLASLEEKIDYLIEASSRMGRKDWIILAVGYVGTTVLDSGVKEQILQGLAATVGHLFGHPLPLLPPH
jgi:hypothetical protein